MTETRVGVDVGGTFTDVVTVEDGVMRVAKTPSTPDAPEEGVLNGVDRAAVTPSAVDFLGHGTTVATNAVLEREWADTALVTTAGFRDALEIGRQDRPALYDLQAEKPAPVVERDRRYEVSERVGERGAVLEPLDEAAVRAIADDLDGVDGVAVCLLFAFENDAHERRVREILREDGGDLHVSVSSAVYPEIREYERTLVTALNAALAPVMGTYLGALGSRLDDRGVGRDLRVMSSAGGLLTADAAGGRPVRTLLSGPAAGVQGATHVAGLAGVEDLITMDMGGTSCDVSLVEEGEPTVTTDVEVGDYPVSVPTVDVHTVGAGGGSVAWIDDGGALRVGPRSAGADPGPVCYGRGGDRPTVTDAHLLLGRLDPGAFLAENVEADRDRVRAVFERDLADPLGVSVREAAEGVLRVANANTERALRVVSVERGHDPRSFALVAFGGAGPLHATTLAGELDVGRVLIPRAAGVLSALGLLVSDVRHDLSSSRVRPWRAVSADDLHDAVDRLRREGRERLAAEGVPADRRRFEPRLDLRYEGQSFELSVPAPELNADSETLDAVAERFHERHERRYGHATPAEPLELVTVRLRARGVVPAPDLRADPVGGDLADAVRETRPVVVDGTEHETRVYDRERLPTDAAFGGPAVVEGGESTLVVRPGDRVTVDDFGTLHVEVDA